MKSLWQSETGHLACRWTEVGQRLRCNPPWFQNTPSMNSGYLPPLPDFASHSPFGGPTWFQPNLVYRDIE